MTKKRGTASKSPEVYLRHPVDEDFGELNRLYLASRRHLREFAALKFDQNAFERLLQFSNIETNVNFLICQVRDDAICGQLSLSQIFRRGFQNCYLGYQLFEGFTGRGYMTDAVSLALKFAFLELGLHRVEANVQPNNAPSIAVLQRNGFEKEGFSRRYLKIGGRWCDHERWAIIKEHWQQFRRHGSKRT